MLGVEGYHSAQPLAFSLRAHDLLMIPVALHSRSVRQTGQALISHLQYAYIEAPKLSLAQGHPIYSTQRPYTVGSLEAFMVEKLCSLVFQGVRRNMDTSINDTNCLLSPECGLKRAQAGRLSSTRRRWG